MHPDFVKPNYDSGGFAGIPRAIKSLYGGDAYPLPVPDLEKRYDNVILFFVDAFGWRFFERFASHPYLNRFTREGHVVKLTSQFPSTTSAHTTCIHSGLNVGQSGIFEWNYYEPKLDSIIVPLLFSFSGTMERDELKKTGIDAKKLYPTHTLYHELKRLGVNSMIFQHREYTPSTYSDILFRGAEVRGYRTLPETLTNLRSALDGVKGKNYFFLYYDKIDSICHEYGPLSPQVEAEIDMFLTTMERQLVSVKKGKTLFLLTADHGQVEVDPATTVYLNKVLPQIKKYIRKNRRGELLVPGGSPRDMFLYIKEEMLDEAQSTLIKKLDGKADVIKTEELIAQGYFGPNVSKVFRERVGNLVILPYRYQSVWWYEKEKFEQKFYGHHGGLTPQEMEIPLLACEL
ncbi:MAG TPA: alkaline phosphatase family protein [Anaerolineales bacterium]|nr:alkaline phosphatase family protein [Anaerolineales bacterium]